jgi:hypothetical protein
MMSDKTAKRLTDQLVKDVNAHPHKDELMHLMHTQLLDELESRTLCEPITF